MMTQHDLQTIFESEFNWESWKKVMNFVFPEFNFNLAQTDLALDTQAKEEKAGFIKVHGQTALASHESLMLCEVLVKDNIRLDRNVKSVRSLVAGEVIPNYQTVIAVFHNADNSKWRFTLVVKEFTEDHKALDKKADSYTYVFGKGEKGRTAAERFYALAGERNKTLGHLERAFSVKALSKKFFTQYKEVYKLFVANIISHPSRLRLFKEPDREKNASDFVKKMMGRIVFLYFLQKKGWMGCQKRWENGQDQFMAILFNTAPIDSTFYMQYLEPLFFDTLNTKRDSAGEDCIINGNNFGKVPFLNGGLFEREANHPENLTLDWELFNHFFEVLNDYNFTIIEDDPDFKEIAVDPEMLGHIFENLLEDNKDKGTFYTPKEIVQYMCQESLIEYLHTALRNKMESNVLKQAIADFVIKQHFVGLNDINQQADEFILKALRNIKVCDPAIGSGAFPMGILHEIFRMVEGLGDRDIFQTIWEMEVWDAARVKENIIQNSIYGVDIEKGAVDIARLRFWLSIIIDEDEPRPLPNLDYKIMQGNSLLERFGPIDLKFDKSKYNNPIQKQENLFGELANPQISIAEAMASKGFDLTTVEQEYFHTQDTKAKELIREKITSFEKSFIAEEIKAKMDIVLKNINIISKRLLRDDNYSKLNDKKKDQRLLKIAEKELVEIGEIEKNSKSIKEGNKPYFLWNLYFMDVFEQGGFDIVIGNPPYIQLQKMGKAADDLQNAEYETFTRTGDIYCLFFELGNKLLLKENGNLIFITSNSWLRANYGKVLRKYFLKNTYPIQLIDLSDSDIFETATVRTSILLFKKAPSSNCLKATRVTRKMQSVLSNFRHHLDENFLTLEYLSDIAWVVNSKEKQTIINLVKSKGKKLVEWDINIYRGIITGFNEAFVISDQKRGELISDQNKSDEIIKPFLRGKDVGRYYTSYKRIYLINSHNGIRSENIAPINVKKDFTSVYQHLMQWKEKLVRRADQGDHWTNLRNCTYFKEFEKPKIVYPNMITDISFAYDSKGFYTNQKCYIITGEKLKFLLGLLNSKLFKFCFEDEFPEVQGNAREINKVVFENIPIKYPKEYEKSLIEEKVNLVLRLKEHDADSFQVEKEIDTLVYKMYDLSYEQVQIIEENKFTLTADEYKKVSL